MTSSTHIHILLLLNSVKSYPTILLCSHPLLFNLVHSTVLDPFISFSNDKLCIFCYFCCSVRVHFACELYIQR